MIYFVIHPGAIDTASGRPFQRGVPHGHLQTQLAAARRLLKRWSG